MTSATTSLDPIAQHAGTLEVHLLGMVDVHSMLSLQEYLVYELSGRTDSSGVLLLCEYPPVITVGREGSLTDIHVDSASLQNAGVETVRVSRGGGAVAHAPGQLVANLLLPLQRLPKEKNAGTDQRCLGLSAFREQFETAMVKTCHELKVPAKRIPDAPGVWGRSGHLATLGAAVRSWISCFGMALNVAIDPSFLSMVSTNPSGEAATSIQAQRLRPVSMAQVREALTRHICHQFGYQESDVSTGHPMLKRTKRRVPTHV